MDGSFRHMKQELAQRGAELDRVRTERNELSSRLEELTGRVLSKSELADVHRHVLLESQRTNQVQHLETVMFEKAFCK